MSTMKNNVRFVDVEAPSIVKNDNNNADKSPKRDSVKMKKVLSKKLRDVTLPTQNIFMMKKIIENPDIDGGLLLVGTFVQKVFGLTKEQSEEGFFFQYRFNEKTADDTTLQKRRSEPINTLDADGDISYGSRTTFQAIIPFDLDIPFKAFPFHIVTATVEIELSSTAEGKQTIRPDLLLHKEESRNIISIQELKPSLNKSLLFGGDFFAELRHKRDSLEDKILDKIDGSKKYDFVSPYPRVYFEYDKKKKYCPRFAATFYCYQSSWSKLINTLFPMVLVSIIAALNTWNDWDSRYTDKTLFYLKGNSTAEDGLTETHQYLVKENSVGAEVLDHLGISSALTLAAVFILPNFMDISNRNTFYSVENMYVTLIFLCLVLSSIPGRLWEGAYILQSAGVIALFLSNLIPISSLFRFKKLQGRITDEMCKLTKNMRFLSDSSYKRWNEKKDNLDQFATVDYFLSNQNNLYGRNEIEEENDKYTRLWYITPSCKH